ncbi:MAG TPA: DUF6655 family protein [Isosphaeraceae bacterium]|jgi:hypothetical protein
MRINPEGSHRTAAALLATLALTLAWGCGSTKMTGTARTGTEQLLLTDAWDKALQRVDFRPLTGVPIYLDTTNVTAVDQGWVVSSLRQALLAQGVLLRAKPEQAQWIVEARVGAYGTDDHNFLIGVPQVSVPPTIPGLPAGTIPEIPLMKKTDQQAVAKLALFAYDRASGQIVWNSGTALATSNAKDVYIGGLGPIQSGTVREGTEFIGVKLPKGASKPASSGPPSRTDPFAIRTRATRAPSADLDSFAP